MFHKVHRLQERTIKTAAQKKKKTDQVVTQKQMKRAWTDQWGHNHVEVPQVHVLGTAELRGKYRNQHLEVLSPLCRVAGQIPQNWI